MGSLDEETCLDVSELAPSVGATRDRAYLVVLSGGNLGEMYKLRPGELMVGRGQRADIFIPDDSVSRNHARIRLEAHGAILEDLGSRNGTFCNGVRLEGNSVTLRDGDKVQVGKTIILKFVFQDHLDESFQQHMYDSSMRDGLTKAFNKRYFEDRLEREVRYSLRHKSPLSLLFLDVDHFKKLNDQHGHIAGDRVLQGFAAAMQASVRSEDVFARFGGEEFAVIARGTKLDDALIFAERLRRRIEELIVPVDELRLSVTTSIGVAGLAEHSCQQAVELVSAADRAVYMAKARGRNRIAACPNEPDAIRSTH